MSEAVVEHLIRLIGALSMNELVLLNERLRDEFGFGGPDIGVREPCNPRTPLGSSAVAVEFEERLPLDEDTR